MAVYDQLIAAKALLATEYQAVAAIIGPTAQKDGQSIDKIGYLRQIREEIRELDDALAQESPYEIRTVLSG